MRFQHLVPRAHRPALLCAAACLAFASLHAATPVEPVPQFRSSDGATHTLNDLRGHPAVVNFWATWCGPCREEMPRLQKLADTYGSRGVQFVAISLDAPDTQSKIPQVIAKRNLRIPVWTGADETTLKALDLGELVPATLILDDTGTVIGRIEGEASDKDIRSRIDWLLNGRNGKQPKAIQRNDW
ncbi:TlpA family protein disulfide reductase [Terriglobus aquaticus]|uniref:TlpA family protein disulfide reductase n=1 Tax=Terriglobus aquaticus TaxID=940139 RepID=A0ABW9KPC8_9BACT|nr:TlpA disulfide reductase family protein [Terriglobus aquaticus]